MRYMGKLLKYIAEETQGTCFTSFKYCYDTITTPAIEYGEAEMGYINLKEYAEDVHDPMPRNMRQRAKICLQGAPLFKFFLDGSRRVYKVDDIQYDKKVFPIVSGQISVACCGREMHENNAFKSFQHVYEESYPVLCLPVTANGVGMDNDVFFRNLCNKLNERLQRVNAEVQLKRILYYLTKLNENETFENKGIAKIQDEMIECEKRIVSYLVSKNLLNQDSYLMFRLFISYGYSFLGGYSIGAKNSSKEIL